MNVTLIGMPAVGKSDAGRKLAELLGYDCIDVDDRVREALRGYCGRDVTLESAISELGEKRFMEIEEEAVLSLGKGKKLENTVISTGGSVVYSESGMQFLKENSLVVYIFDSPENIFKRLSKNLKRGIVKHGNKTFGELYSERDPLYYKSADLNVLAPEPLSVRQVAEMIKVKMEELGKGKNAAAGAGKIRA